MRPLPTSPDAFVGASWADISPYYDDLAAASVDASTAESWLAHWSRLEELIAQAGTRALMAYTCDTADAEKERVYLQFYGEIYPQADAQQVRLARRLLDLEITRSDLQTTLERFRTDVRIFREENIPLVSELEGLDAQYQKITGGLTVPWRGETLTIPQLQPLLQDADRSVREQAFRLGAAAYLEQRQALSDIFDGMYARRQQIASNSGFADYQAYAFASKHRFDYTPADCARFHDAVEATVVPAMARLHEFRRERLGVDTLRPWDLGVDPDGAPALRPFANTRQFVETATRAFGALDPQLGDWFAEMDRAGLLDLESRTGKAPGGYCTKLPVEGLPFIFMNAVGVADDVNTLVHEAGHCFHVFAARHLPYLWQRGTGSEAAELASMSMELLAAPHLIQPTGYYTPDEARRAQLEHLEDVILSLAHIASVDAFQAWIYTSRHGHDAAARDAAWLEIRARFERGVDWSGLAPERTARWYRQLHIFEHPFYYIEYGIAQLGALQVWRRSLEDPAAAVRAYRDALRLGGSVSLPEMYRAAGAKLVFDADTMGELVALVEGRISELRRATPVSPAHGVAAVAR
ncbi:MAG: M3 family oligoendopeptidase [Gemmatimonadaceae bacterium]|nr:M3 family oligoendopeptidase [Gemmatimonadaceae bacterium]